VNLTAIIPVHKMAGKLELFESWISRIDTPQIHLIIVEDGQDTETFLALKSITSRLPANQYKLMSGKYGSPGAARNAGLEQAETKWVAFWDSDDLPNVKAFIEMVNQAEYEKSNVAIGKFNKRNFIHGDSVDTIPEPLSIMKIARNPGLWRWAFTRELIGNLKFSDSRMGEDQLFLAELSPFNSRVTLFNANVYTYSINVPDQLTTKAVALDEILQVIPESLVCVRKNSGPQKSFNLVMSYRQVFTALKRLQGVNRLKSARYLLRLIALTIKSPSVYFVPANWRISGSERINNKKAILVNLTGGLGNQLFQIAAAINLADRRSIIGLTSLGKPRTNSAGMSEIQSFKLPSQIEITNKRASLLSKKTTGYLLRSGIWPKSYESNPVVKKISLLLGRLVLSSHLRKIVYLQTATDVGFEIFNIKQKRNYLLIGYFQSSRWLENASTRSLMNSIHLENPEPELKSLIQYSALENPLVIHVRLGDYRNEPTFGLLDSDYYEKAIEIHMRKWSPENFWVFSDEIDSAKEIIPVAYHHKIRWISEVDNSTAATFEAMRLGSGYIIANSSFSWWSAALSRSDSPVVIAPKPWFVGQSEPKGLIPSNWISLAR
jgi:glycosyltransferase involved in cell wall biosynthesis